jgi:hypothetical protein
MDEPLFERFLALGRFGRIAHGHVPDVEQAGIDRDAFGRLQALVERATTRLRLGAGDEGHHTVVALAGATGVGKVQPVQRAGPDRRVAGRASATHHRPRARLCLERAVPGRCSTGCASIPPAGSSGSPLDAEDEATLRGLVLLDLPDVDSVAGEHRLEADRLVGIVDLVIWVLDPQKYADRAVHEEYLREMGVLRDVTVVVFNQVDKLSAVDADRCRADLARLVEADGLPGVPVIGTSAVTGEGVDAVRALLEKAVAGRPAAMARLEGELQGCVDTVAPLVAGDPIDEDLVSREAVHELADGFAAAIGVGTIATEAAIAYRVRAVVPGRPFRRAGVEANAVDVPSADPAAVGLAVRGSDPSTMVAAGIVAGVGVVVAAVLPLVAGAVARAGAARYRRQLEGRLHEATFTVASEVVAPVRVVLRDYADSRDALITAADPDRS